MKQEDDPIVGEFTHGQGLMFALVATAVFIAFEYFGDNGRARTALVSTAAILSAIKIFWPLRHYSWFWLTIGGVALAHGAAVMWLPLSGESFDGIRIAPVALLDIAVVCLIIFALAKAKNIDVDRTLSKDRRDADD